MKRYMQWLFIFATAVSAFTETAINPSQPTHLFYTPMPRVNPPQHLVLSLHEISFSFPYNLQVQASLLDNIGRLNFGAKFGINDNLAFGAGLAHSIVHIGNGAHGIPSEASARFGVFLTWGAVMQNNMLFAITPHMQLGDHNSMGFDLGIYIKPNPVWGVIVEHGNSIDITDGVYYMNLDGGLRITPPSIPFLEFDGGIDLEEFPVKNHGGPNSVTIYFDCIFSMIVK